MPQPQAALSGGRWGPCVQTGLEGLSGGNWMVDCDSPGTPGGPLRPDGASVPSMYRTSAPPGAEGPGGTPLGRSPVPASEVSG
jgi:hypothetical protein